MSPTDWDAVAAQWRAGGHTQATVNAMLVDAHARGLEDPPAMPEPPPPPTPAPAIVSRPHNRRA